MEKDTSTLCENMDEERFESRFGFTDDALRTSLQLRSYRRLLGVSFVLIGICLLVAIVALGYSIKASHEPASSPASNTAKLVGGSEKQQSLVEALERTNRSLEKLKGEVNEKQKSLNKTIEELRRVKTGLANHQQVSNLALIKLNETLRDNQEGVLKEVQRLRSELETHLARAQQEWNSFNNSMREVSRSYNTTISNMYAQQMSSMRRLQNLQVTQINELQQELLMRINERLPGASSVSFPPFTTPRPSLALVPCTSPDTVNLTESWRKDYNGSNIKPGGSYNCDAHLFDDMQWFRITGAAGNRILNSCPPKYSCGSHGGIWTNATMPTEIGVVVNVALHGSWSHCTWYPFDQDNSLTVLRCSPAYGDFVYKIDGKTGCNWSVCSMD